MAKLMKYLINLIVVHDKNKSLETKQYNDLLVSRT